MHSPNRLRPSPKIKKYESLDSLPIQEIHAIANSTEYNKYEKQLETYCLNGSQGELLWDRYQVYQFINACPFYAFKIASSSCKSLNQYPNFSVFSFWRDDLHLIEEIVYWCSDCPLLTINIIMAASNKADAIEIENHLISAVYTPPKISFILPSYQTSTHNNNIINNNNELYPIQRYWVNINCKMNSIIMPDNMLDLVIYYYNQMDVVFNWTFDNHNFSISNEILTAMITSKDYNTPPTPLQMNIIQSFQQVKDIHIDVVLKNNEIINVLSLLCALKQDYTKLIFLSSSNLLCQYIENKITQLSQNNFFALYLYKGIEYEININYHKYSILIVESMEQIRYLMQARLIDIGSVDRVIVMPNDVHHCDCIDNVQSFITTVRYDYSDDYYNDQRVISVGKIVFPIDTQRQFKYQTNDRYQIVISEKHTIVQIYEYPCNFGEYHNINNLTKILNHIIQSVKSNRTIIVTDGYHYNSFQIYQAALKLNSKYNYSLAVLSENAAKSKLQTFEIFIHQNINILVCSLSDLSGMIDTKYNVSLIIMNEFSDYSEHLYAAKVVVTLTKNTKNAEFETFPFVCKDFSDEFSV
eukprot:296754_1